MPLAGHDIDVQGGVLRTLIRPPARNIRQKAGETRRNKAPQANQPKGAGKLKLYDVEDLVIIIRSRGDAMEGIHFVTDANGKKIAVQLAAPERWQSRR